jgi:DNA-binding NarL/FixJ family response regulator
MLTTFDLDEYVYTALRAGASGLLLKDTPRRELLHAEVIAAGDALISPNITRRRIAEFAARRDPQTPLPAPPNSPIANATPCSSSPAASATTRLPTGS